VYAPPIQQPLSQIPATHTSPVPQLVPLTTFVQVDVEVVAWQLWHTFPLFVAPLP
jgi:hypothetical protein